MVPTHTMLTDLMMMTIMLHGRRDHHLYHMTIHMLTFPLQMFVYRLWKWTPNLEGRFERVERLVLRHLAGVFPDEVQGEGEIGIISQGHLGENTVTILLHLNERMTQIHISHFLRPRGWLKVRQGMRMLRMRPHPIPMFNRLLMHGSPPRQTISKITDNLSSSPTLILDLHLHSDSTCHLEPWVHVLLRTIVTTMRLNHSIGRTRGQCKVAQVLKVKRPHIDRCSPDRIEWQAF